MKKWNGKAYKDKTSQSPGRSVSRANDRQLAQWVASAKKFGYTQFFLEIVD